MAKKKSTIMNYTHPKDSKANTYEGRIEELLGEGIAISDVDRGSLKDLGFDFREAYCRGYKNGIECEIENPEVTNSQGWMARRGFVRFFIIPSTPQHNIYEYYLKSDLSSQKGKGSSK